MINLVITDDHPMIIEGLKRMFSNYPHLNISAAYQYGAHLLKGLENGIPDVLILDIQLHDKNGDELVPELLQRYPDLKILVVTNFDSVMYAKKMMWQGVKGYVLKTTEEQELINAIEKIHSGGTFIEKHLIDLVNDGKGRENKRIYTSKTTITEREKEILQLIVEGKTDQEIAAMLFLGLNTIKFYRKGLLMKLDVTNTASLVAKALKTGLVV